MDDFAKLSADERRVYFEQAAAQLNLSAQIIEKDFWVCWTLRRLFSLGEFQEHMTFKGGTSLSKVYKLIERFSEDVDVAIERDFLGFGGEHNPEATGVSGKEQQRRIDKLKTACQTIIASRLQPQLHAAIAEALGTDHGWTLELDEEDPDRQSLRFEYPPAITDRLVSYFKRSVKIEMGARSDHFPVEQQTIQPYVCDAFPDLLDAAETEVRVLSARRTFWEKATILHWLHYLPEGKPLPLRMSRHYYDLYQLAGSSVLDEAMADIELLDRVAVFKSVYFKTSWAKYPEAADGAIRLSPPERLVAEIRQDYEDMQPMFFVDPPAFDELIAPLSGLEERINATAR